MEQRAGGVEPGHLFFAHSPHEEGLLHIAWPRPHLRAEEPEVMDLAYFFRPNGRQWGRAIPWGNGLFVRERTLAIPRQKIMRKKLAIPEPEPRL